MSDLAEQWRHTSHVTDHVICDAVPVVPRMSDPSLSPPPSANRFQSEPRRIRFGAIRQLTY